MPTVHSIGEADLTELEPKDPIMLNSKLLYAATVAVSLLSSLAMADEAPLTRAQVNADTQQAMANGTLRRTDYDDLTRGPVAASTKTRADTAVEFADAKAARKALIGPDANRTYNPFGTEILKTSTLARADVKADVLQAAANGTLQRTDYDDAALVARRAKAHAASATFAQRFKAALARSNG
jgi:Domain of unknown function (DUF4148)